MKMNIRNKLNLGFAGLLLLMAIVAVNGCLAFFTMKRSAHEATTVGGRLNSVALEIQVHNLEAQRRVKNFLLDAPVIGLAQAKDQYLEEAQFEIHEIRTLADKAVGIAPDAEKRSKFDKVAKSAVTYEAAVNSLISAVGNGGDEKAAVVVYEDAAEKLHESAEDGEVAGRDASQSSEENIKRVSDRSIALALGISLAGLVLGIAASYFLSRAILIPVDHLKDVAENVSMGNLQVEVHRYSNDEIGDLADSFARMVTAVKFFRMEAELTQEETLAHKGSRD
jgi:HAMP domain-containing protein